MKKSYLFAALSIFVWSTMPTISKLLLGDFTSMQVLSVSALFAALALLVVNIATGNIKKLKNYRPADYLITALIGLPGTFLYYVFFYSGTARMLASQAFIINYLWPIMSVVFACILLKEKMTVRKAAAIVISFVGVAVVTGGDLLFGFSMDTVIGAVFCILGAVSYGIFTALNQKKNYDKRLSMMMFFAVTFVLTSIINLANGDTFSLNLMQTLGLAWNGMFSMAIGTTSWAIALESGNTAKISNLAYITPFVSLIWTSVFLKEKISIFSVIGLVVIVLGIFIQLKDKKQAASVSSDK